MTTLAVRESSSGRDAIPDLGNVRKSRVVAEDQPRYTGDPRRHQKSLMGGKARLSQHEARKGKHQQKRCCLAKPSDIESLHLEEHRGDRHDNADGELASNNSNTEPQWR